MFLIQNCQETERQVEELKQQFSSTKTDTLVKSEAQKKQIKDLNASIALEEGKQERLEQRMATQGSDSAQAELLRKLNAKVALVYEQCGFGDGARLRGRHCRPL